MPTPQKRAYSWRLRKARLGAHSYLELARGVVVDPSESLRVATGDAPNLSNHASEGAGFHGAQRDSMLRRKVVCNPISHRSALERGLRRALQSEYC